MTNILVFHRRTKHISIKYQFLQEAIDNKEIELKYCKILKQLANIFTKAFPQVKFEALRDQHRV